MSDRDRGWVECLRWCGRPVFSGIFSRRAARNQFLQRFPAVTLIFSGKSGKGVVEKRMFCRYTPQLSRTGVVFSRPWNWDNFSIPGLRSKDLLRGNFEFRVRLERSRVS